MIATREHGGMRAEYNTQAEVITIYQFGNLSAIIFEVSPQDWDDVPLEALMQASTIASRTW